MAQQVGPRCCIQQSDTQLTVEVRGAPDDDLSDVVSAAHNEFKWRLDDDFVSVRNHEVVTVTQDDDGVYR